MKCSNAYYVTKGIRVSLIGLAAIFIGEKFFLKRHKNDEDDPNYLFKT